MRRVAIDRTGAVAKDTRPRTRGGVERVDLAARLLDHLRIVEDAAPTIMAIVGEPARTSGLRRYRASWAVRAATDAEARHATVARSAVVATYATTASQTSAAPTLSGAVLKPSQ